MDVAKISVLCSLSFLLVAVAGGHQAPIAHTPSQPWQPGVIIPEIVASAHPEQSYALYLPSKYSPEKKWPIVYAFDPAARGSMPVVLMKDAAERFGYIVVGSNNSRNGSWKIEAQAAQAMFQDTGNRLAIDNQRVYFAGFSGGARVASQLAQRCKCAAGVLLNGAGFSAGSAPSTAVVFPVFAAVGNFDFNYGELIELDAKLAALKFSHWLRRFEGPHEWAPQSAMAEAFAWFRLMAMKNGSEPRDESFISAQSAERARTLEESGDLYLAWFEYRQTAETFDKLTDITPLQERATALENEKAVREGAKREKQELEEQRQLESPISAGMAALGGNDPNRTDTRHQLEQEILGLRGRAEHEKHADKLRIEKRALAGVLVAAMEEGGQRLDANDPSRAQDYFELASDADPDSVWALSNLAVARALTGNRKGVLDALRRAKQKTKDAPAFLQWLQAEPAFTKFRSAPEFAALLDLHVPQ